MSEVLLYLGKERPIWHVLSTTTTMGSLSSESYTQLAFRRCLLQFWPRYPQIARVTKGS